MNQEFLDLQAVFRKGTGRDQIANMHWIIEKAREFKKKKTIYFYFIDYAKAFDCVFTTNCGKRETCIQEATVRIGHGITDWFKVGKGVHQGCILSHWFFNLYANTSWEMPG